MRNQIVGTQIEVQNIADAIHSFTLKTIAQPHGNTLIRHNDKAVVDITPLTDQEIVSDFVMYPTSNGFKVLDKGLTTAFAIPTERVTDNKYFIESPEYVYPNIDWTTELNGFGYTIEVMDSTWLPQSEF